KPVTYLLENMLVNLADSGAKRYLKISLSLDCEAKGKSEASLKELLEGMKAQLRDRLIEIVSARTVASLEGRENKVALKADIQHELAALLFPKGEGKITRTYYQEFFIQ